MWNSRDLDKILSYYTEDVIFHSPRIRIVRILSRAAMRSIL